MGTPKRNNTIDLLRFAAALWVAIYHFHAKSNINNFWISLFKEGWLGVPIFFVVSGYCIAIALNHSATPMQFLIRRIFRIYPAYWASLGIVLFIIGGYTAIYHVNSIIAIPKTIGGALCTFFLITKPFNDVELINGVYWTLPYEISFYVVVFIASYLSERWFRASLVIITLVCCVVPEISSGPFIFLNQWPIFALGFAIHNILHKNIDFPILNYGFLCAALAALCFSAQSVYIPLASIVTCSLIVIDDRYPLRESFLTRLGDLSYSIYLLHLPIGVYLFGWVRQNQVIESSEFLNFIVDLLLVLNIALISKVVHQYIEVPGINIGKKLTSSSRQFNFFKPR